MDRQLNYIFSIALVFVFVLWAPVGFHRMIILGAVASFLFCGAAFIFKWLSLDGAASAMVVGTITLGIGGWPVALALLIFFLSSALISFSTRKQIDTTVRRNGLQVWANGFWIAAWLILGIITNLFVCWMAVAAAIATATADTWATELGSRRFNAETYSSSTFKKVPAGTDGGISLPGLGASLAGSMAISLIIFLGFSLKPVWLVLIVLAGLAGSLFDSYLGATMQGASHSLKISQFNISKKLIISNNIVNWAATGLGSLLVIILNLIFL